MLIGRQLSKNRFQNWHLKVLKVFYQSVIWSPFLSYNMLPLLNHGLQKQCSFQEEQRINWRQRVLKILRFLTLRSIKITKQYTTGGFLVMSIW